ncbi:hypothetical protein JNUCC1_01555 [Lentibacillus sp. JNUCC-1]|nr:hypothetical protein [Lentibacillus sp. JNUCC-1]
MFLLGFTPWREVMQMITTDNIMLMISFGMLIAVVMSANNKK